MATNSSDNLVKHNEVTIAVIPWPEYSHINQLFILACSVASYNINIPVHFLCLADRNQDLRLRVQGGLRASNIHFHDLSLPSSTETDDDHAFDGLPPISVLLIKLSKPISTACLELSSNAKRLVIIYDSLMRRSMSHVLPLIPNVNSYIFQSHSAFTRYSLLQQSIGYKTQLDDEYLLPTMESCFGPYMETFIKRESEWKLHSGELMNTCRGVEGKYLDLLANETGKKPLWAVGPLHMLLESPRDSLSSSNLGGTRHECLEFLDRQDANSVIFVSFGTNTTFSQEQVNELALGLEQSSHRFIWVQREADKKMDGIDKPGEKEGIELPEGFEKRVEGRGMVARNWVPQLEILGHSATGGFLSHCGWNSCLESISMGVPIAAWPNNADQPYNAVFVMSVLKVGISVWSWDRREELVTAAAVEKAVKTLMGSSEGEEMRQRAMELSNKMKNSIVSHDDGGLAHKEMESFMSYITK